MARRKITPAELVARRIVEMAVESSQPARRKKRAVLADEPDRLVPLGYFRETFSRVTGFVLYTQDAQDLSKRKTFPRPVTVRSGSRIRYWKKKDVDTWIAVNARHYKELWEKKGGRPRYREGMALMVHPPDKYPLKRDE